jgi:hypothetical protein
LHKVKRGNQQKVYEFGCVFGRGDDRPTRWHDGQQFRVRDRILSAIAGADGEGLEWPGSVSSPDLLDRHGGILPPQRKVVRICELECRNSDPMSRGLSPARGLGVGEGSVMHQRRAGQSPRHFVVMCFSRSDLAL